MSTGILKMLNGSKIQSENQPTQKKLVKVTSKVGGDVKPLKENVLRKVQAKKTSSSKLQKVKIFDETLKKYKSTGTQTGPDGEDELAPVEEWSEKYWELLAEERRKALAEALEENKQLAQEVESQKTTIEEMKLEIEMMEEMTRNPQYLLSFINEMIRKNHNDEEKKSASPQTSVENAVAETSLPDNSAENEAQEEFNPTFSDSSCSSHDSNKENKDPNDTLPLHDISG